MEKKEGELSQNQANNGGSNTPPDPPFEIPFIGGNQRKGDSGENQHSDATGETQQKYNLPFPIIIKGDDRNNLHPRIANLIAAVALILGIGAFYYTYQLFKETQSANKTTREALRHQVIKDSLDDITKRKDDSERENEHNGEIKREHERFRLESIGTEAQINAFKKQEERFEIENEPYLQLDSVEIVDFGVGKEIVARLSFANLGTYPAEIISNDGIIVLGYNPITYKQLRRLLANSKLHKHISLLSPYFVYRGREGKIDLHSRALIANDNIGLLRSNTIVLYVTGRCKYKNEITGAVKECLYMARVNPFDNSVEFENPKNY